MAGTELQRAIDDLRARIKPENAEYLEAVASHAGCLQARYERLALLRDTIAGALATASAQSGDD